MIPSPEVASDSSLGSKHSPGNAGMKIQFTDDALLTFESGATATSKCPVMRRRARMTPRELADVARHFLRHVTGDGAAKLTLGRIAVVAEEVLQHPLHLPLAPPPLEQGAGELQTGAGERPAAR